MADTVCCKHCGRDTVSKTGICVFCTGSFRGPKRLPGGINNTDKMHECLEDDYSEESNPNSVCNDGHYSD